MYTLCKKYIIRSFFITPENVSWKWKKLIFWNFFLEKCLYRPENGVFFVISFSRKSFFPENELHFLEKKVSRKWNVLRERRSAVLLKKIKIWKNQKCREKHDIEWFPEKKINKKLSTKWAFYGIFFWNDKKRPITLQNIHQSGQKLVGIPYTLWDSKIIIWDIYGT